MTMYQSQLNFMPVRVGNKKVKPLRLIRHVIVPPCLLPRRYKAQRPNYIISRPTFADTPTSKEQHELKVMKSFYTPSEKSLRLPASTTQDSKGNNLPSHLSGSGLFVITGLPSRYFNAYNITSTWPAILDR